MKIGIIGNYGATNIGDDAILTAILKELEGHKVTIFSSNPEAWKATFGTKSAPLFPLGIRSIYKYGFKNSIQALKKVEAVILGGGGLFQDNYLLACFIWAWQIFWIRIFKKRLFVYAVGVGPLKTWLGKKLTKWAFEQAEMITVRDEYSAQTLRNLGLRREIHIVTDPVFSYKKPNFAKGRTKNLFIISLRPWLKYNTKIIHSFGDFLEKLKAEKEAQFIFTSMQQIAEEDLQMIRPLIRRVGGEIYIPQHFSDLLQVMETAEFAIGMRYHFMIAALLTETPLIPITYAPKTEVLFEDTPLKDHICRVEELSERKIVEKLKRLSVGYNNAAIYEKNLAKKYAEGAQKTAVLLQTFLKTFDPPKKEW